MNAYKDEVIKKLQELVRNYMLEDITMYEFSLRVAKIERVTERTIPED